MERKTIDEQVIEFFESSTGAYRTQDVARLIEPQHRLSRIYHCLSRLYNKGKLEKDIAQGLNLWIWKNHIPEGVTPREYILGLAGGPFVIEIQADDPFEAMDIVRGFTILDVPAVPIDVHLTRYVFQITYKWPESLADTLRNYEKEREQSARTKSLNTRRG